MQRSVKRPERDGALDSECDRLNTLHPVGSNCVYWRGKREGPGVKSRTRTRFEIMSGHTVVVWVDGEGGAISSTHVEFGPFPSEAA